MKSKLIFYCLIVYLISFINFIIMIIKDNLSGMIALPFVYSFGLLIILLKDKNIHKSIIRVLILMLFGIRMVLYPLLCTIENDSILYEPTTIAVFLQIYEYFFIILFLSFNKTKIEDKKIDIKVDNYKTKILKFIISIFVLISIVLIVKYPAFLNKFRPLLFSSEEAEREWIITAANTRINIPILFYYLGGWLLSLIKIIIVYLLLIFIRKKGKKNKVINLRLLLSILAISSLLLIVTSDKAGSFYAAISLFLLILQFYDSKRKKIINLGILMLFTVLLIIFVLVPLLNTNSVNIAERINAYFSGTRNIYAGLNLSHYNPSEYIIGDIFRYIPLVVSKFTKYPQTNDIFNFVLGKDVIYNSQIMPNIIQGYFYFGVILSPIFSVILLLLAIKCEKKAKNCSDSFGYFIYYYFAIFFSVGIILYYFSLTFYLVFQYVLPLYILYIFFIRKEKKNESVNLF